MATTVILEDVESGAFDAKLYLTKVAAGERESITVETLRNNISHPQVTSITAAKACSILVEHVPTLTYHRLFVTNIHYRFHRHQLRHRKTRFYPMLTSGYDEALATSIYRVI